MVVELLSVRLFTLSIINISATSQPIAIKFYQKHHWGGGKVAIGFVPRRIRPLISMATDSSQGLTVGEKQKKSSSPKPQGPELSYFVCSNV